MKNINSFLFALLFVSSIVAQKGPGRNWYQKKTSKDTMGIDLFRAYDFLKDKAAKDIVVAVIDGGTDISHPDLKANIWHNPGEIPFNNIDDDHNGYVDDTVGWDFIGNPNGETVEFDNLEKTRILRNLEKEFDDVDADDVAADPDKHARYEYYKKLKEEVEKEKEQYEQILPAYSDFKKMMEDIREKTGKENPTVKEVEDYPTAGTKDMIYKSNLLKTMKEGVSFSNFYKQVTEGYDQFYAFSHYHYNTAYDCRKIVGDHYNNSSERYYGNNNVTGPDASHGTHVAGIIAALRNNGYGMDGIANHVKIMVVRVVPNGDERDKDVANGIRYAVDNGAKIINMSFGKEYRWNKAVVDSAVRYAVSKGVLLVHAAGNDNKDNDVVPNYPNDSLGNNTFASTWIEVGASTPSRKKLAASFSNYGIANVDVFAPGYQIYSTTPNSEFEFFDGTSMASPVTAGVAALVWSYYPSLTAQQVKDILMRSAVVVKSKVPQPGGGKTKFKNLSVSGGVVNAYNAVKLASQLAK